MNQILKAARPDLRTIETVWWSAPATPSLQYDKDGNPGTVVVAFPGASSRISGAETAASDHRRSMDIPRSSRADYDDGDPGTVLT